MIYLKTEEEIGLMRKANRLVAKTLAEIAGNITPGITTQHLDKVADTFIRDHGAIPSFLGYKGFPKSICISINDQVVHGIPSQYELKEGDIVSVDIGATLNGFNGDSAYTFCVGEVEETTKQLLKTTKEALYKGIEAAVEGKRTGDIGATIQHYCEKRGYSVVRDLVGHGIGRQMHEEPEIPNYGKRGYGQLLRKGMCIAIEPMINAGTRNVVTEKDGWTMRTRDRKPSAHFEHTITIGGDKPEILSTFEYIEEALGGREF